MASRQHLFMGKLFLTQKDLLNAIGEWANGAPTGRLEGPDEVIAQELLTRHHDYAGKVGVGISHIELRPARKNRLLRELWAVRVDGTEEDFSWSKCITGKPTARTHVMDALRHAVAPQILDFRRTFFATTPNPTCPISGAPLRNDPTTHIDHDVPLFVELANRWIAQQGGSSNISLEDQPTSITSRVLSDPMQLQSWIEFHRENASLRAVSSTTNLKRSRRSVNLQ